MSDINNGSGTRGRRWMMRGAVALAAVIVVFHAAGGWYFSGKIDAGGLTPSAPERNYGVEVIAVEDGNIVLIGDDDAISDPGIYALVWDSGHATVGDVVAANDTTVTRRLLSAPAKLPTSPSEVDLDAWMFETPQDVGLRYSDVAYASALGDMDAWLVPGSSTSSTWVIHVHGWRADRREALRSLPAFHDAGMHSLVISYRNDPGAPPDPSERYQFGQTEWADLEAAARYAIDNGADHIVLSGFSTGGAIATAFVAESELADHVIAIILDSPNLDFGHVVKTEASRTNLIPGVPINVPSSLTATAMAIARVRYDIDWQAINYVDHSPPIHVPALIFHGSADTTVPPEVSQRYAAANPDRVTLVITEGAAHVRSWNTDPATYQTTLTTFLNSL